MDQGANRSIASNIMQHKFFTDRKVNVTGISNHQMPNLQIGIFNAVTKNSHGNIILVFHWYARTIHFSWKLEPYGAKVDDRALKVGRTQTITQGEYVFSLDIVDGLPYIPWDHPVIKKGTPCLMS